MTTNVEPPRPGVVGGAAGMAPGITTTPGVSKKEPVGERESHVRECQTKSWRHSRVFHTRAPLVKVANLHQRQSLGIVGQDAWR